MSTLDYQPKNPKRKLFSARNLTLLGVSLVSLLAAAWIVGSRMTKPAVMATAGSLIQTTNDAGTIEINARPLLPGETYEPPMKDFAEMHNFNVACFVRNGGFDEKRRDFRMNGNICQFQDVQLISLSGGKGLTIHPSSNAATKAATNGIYFYHPAPLEPSETKAVEELKHNPVENRVQISDVDIDSIYRQATVVAAVRLQAACVQCHDKAPVGTLLGAFEYSFFYFK